MQRNMMVVVMNIGETRNELRVMYHRELFLSLKDSALLRFAKRYVDIV